MRMVDYDSLGILEFHSIPRGLKILNEIAKNTLLEVEYEFISMGRCIGYLLGEYGSVDHGMCMAIERGYDCLIDIGLLGNPHEQVTDYLRSQNPRRIKADNILIIQLSSHSKLLERVSNILHHTPVELVKIDYGDYMDGASIAIFSGAIDALMLANEDNMDGELITNFDSRLLEQLIKGEK